MTIPTGALAAYPGFQINAKAERVFVYYGIDFDPVVVAKRRAGGWKVGKILYRGLPELLQLAHVRVVRRGLSQVS